MIIKIIPIFILFIYNAMLAQNSPNEFLTLLKKSLAPDKRTVIFNVNLLEEKNKIILEGEVMSKVLKDKVILELKNNFQYEIEDKIIVLPEKKLGDKLYGLISLSVANIRVKPDHPEEMATQSLMGTPVKILKEKDGWYLIQTPDEYLGWIEDEAIYLMSESELNVWKKSKRIIFNSSYGQVFSDKELKAPLSDIVKGCILESIEDDTYITHVKLPDGRIGYINSKEAEDFNKWIKNSKLNPENVIKSAKLLMGIPYLWGGTSFKGVDCSGFTKTAYYLNGIILPRDASQQVFVGDEIQYDNSFKSLLPGDLLFFGKKKTDTNKEKVTHVALYLGDKNYIHSSGFVRINSFDKNSSLFVQKRLDSLLKVKRFFPDKETPEFFINKNKLYN